MINDAHRQEAMSIFQAALRGVDPYTLTQAHNDRIRSTYQTGNFRRLILTGFGKAAFPMAMAVSDGLRDMISRGILIGNDGQVLPNGLWPEISVYQAAHPVPDCRGVQASEQLVGLLKEADHETLAVCLISGGGSALLVAPSERITLAEKQETTRLLLKAGADIRELNAVRKHLSRVKGGRLAEMAFPAKVLSLILSDVIGDSLDVIASGPTAPDRTTYGNALAVLRRYDLTEKIPPNVLGILMCGVRGEMAETPKEGNPIFDRVEHVIVGSNRQALQIAEAQAVKRGYRTSILSSALQGEAREAGRWLARQSIEIYRTAVLNGREKICLLSGGETTVTVAGNGLGGRNTELALAFARELSGMKGITLLSAGTDGTDGPTDAAGAIVDMDTLTKARAAGLDPDAYLANNDAYHFHQMTGGLLMTGPTGTNVMDLQIILMGDR